MASAQIATPAADPSWVQGRFPANESHKLKENPLKHRTKLEVLTNNVILWICNKIKAGILYGVTKYVTVHCFNQVSQS